MDAGRFGHSGRRIAGGDVLKDLQTIEQMLDDWLHGEFLEVEARRLLIRFAFVVANRVEAATAADQVSPVPMLIYCPECKARHIDRGTFATKEHHTHSCQSCGHTWRPAVIPTVGVQFLPGFKDPE